MDFSFKAAVVALALSMLRAFQSGTENAFPGMTDARGRALALNLSHTRNSFQSSLHHSICVSVLCTSVLTFYSPVCKLVVRNLENFTHIHKRAVRGGQNNNMEVAGSPQKKSSSSFVIFEDHEPAQNNVVSEWFSFT